MTPRALLMVPILLLSAAAAEFRPPRTTADGFAVPQPGRRFEFPRDHGSHPEFKIEWWYITGHLFTDRDRRFGFQATFFRRAAPRSAPAASPGAFGHAHLHLAHMALLDVQGARFLHEERLNRDGWDARASETTLDVRNGNWSLRLGTNTGPELQLQGSIHGAARFDLDLVPAKPLVFFGENGVSRKAATPEAASHYLTFSRLKVSGELTLDGVGHPVHGEAWMDHEISSSQLDDDQVGWDWAGIQLKDGREIMAYRLRRKDGSADPFSTLAWVDPNGAVTHLGSDQFTWTGTDSWTSSATGARYPLPVTLRTVDPATGMPVTFLLEPLLKDQELTGGLGGVAYWEGACRVLDERGREAGSAFVELTGYAGSLRERFR